MKLQLMLNQQVKEVDAKESKYAYFTVLRVDGIEVRTSNGNKTHIGWLDLRPNSDPDHIYTEKDIREIRYHGMKGNGHATPSSFRYIGFPV